MKKKSKKLINKVLRKFKRKTRFQRAMRSFKGFMGI